MVSRSPAPRVDVELRASVGALWGMVPGDDIAAQVSPTVSLGVGLRRGALSLSVEVWTSLVSGSQSITLQAAAGQRAALTAVGHPVGITVTPCGRVGAFDLCAVLQSGVYVARGEGYPDATGGVASWLGLGARVAWTFLRAGPVSLHAAAEVVALPLGPQLHLTLQSQDQLAWEAPAAVAALSIGARWRAP